MLAKQVRDAVGFTHALPHAMMIQGYLLLEHGSFKRGHLVNLLDEAAAVQQC